MVQSIGRRPELFRQGKILIYGMGKSGQALADLLREGEFPFQVTDDRPETLELARADGLDCLTLDAAGTAIAGGEFHLLAVSPGIRPDTPLLRAAAAAQLLVLGELESAWHLSRGRVVAITGTNGKTTTATLTAALLEAGFPGRVWLAGNIGTAYSSVAARTRDEDWTVLEVSSFQVHATRWFAPDVYVLLNITPDHLNWHRDFDDYLAAKLRPLGMMDGGNATRIWNADDPVLEPRLRQLPGRGIAFSLQGREDAAIRRTDAGLCLAGTAEILRREEIRLPGDHNLENVMAALAVAQVCAGVALADCRRVLADFSGVEHRLEPAGTVAGVDFINDSKATNVASTLVALKAMTRPTRIILGGSEKGEDFSPLAPAIGASTVVTIHLVGATAGRLADCLTGVRPIERWDSFDRAVEGALASARPGDVVLLSPACASFDFFRDFEHRGRHFKERVEALAAGSR